METVEDFEAHALQAERSAQAAHTEQERDAYLKIAKGWHELIADRRERIGRGF